jgi:hypothetical protein
MSCILLVESGDKIRERVMLPVSSFFPTFPLRYAHAQLRLSASRSTPRKSSSSTSVGLWICSVASHSPLILDNSRSHSTLNSWSHFLARKFFFSQNHSILLDRRDFLIALDHTRSRLAHSCASQWTCVYDYRGIDRGFLSQNIRTDQRLTRKAFGSSDTALGGPSG